MQSDDGYEIKVHSNMKAKETFRVQKTMLHTLIDDYNMICISGNLWYDMMDCDCFMYCIYIYIYTLSLFS